MGRPLDGGLAAGAGTGQLYCRCLGGSLMTWEGWGPESYQLIHRIWA